MIIDPNGIAKALGAAGSAGHGIADENAAGPHFFWGPKQKRASSFFGGG